MTTRAAHAQAPEGYEVSRVLSEGTAATAFVVTNPDGIFVCKRLVPRAREDAGARARLEREGRILEALAGRGAPALAARGADEHGPYVVMAHAEGAPLVHAREHGQGRLARAALAAFDALARVHE